MTYQKTIKMFALAALALAFAPASFAATSGCTDNANSPITYGTTQYAYFTCSLYDTAPTQNLNLDSVLTQGGTLPLVPNNLLPAGYLVVINGNPATLSTTSLYNESLWEAVLYFPGDYASGTQSDLLTVYYPGAFPSASTVQTLDESLYGAGNDAENFVQATGTETVAGGNGSPGTYDIYTPAAATPEPSSLCLMFSGMLGLGLLAGVKGFRSPFAGRA
jgi:hypothetical protein